MRRVVDKSVSKPDHEISESSTNEYALNILAEQLQAKDQQIDKLQQALDQECQQDIQAGRFDRSLARLQFREFLAPILREINLKNF